MAHSEKRQSKGCNRSRPVVKIFASINRKMLESWGGDPFPTHARIYHLLNELNKLDDIEVQSIKYEQLPGTSLIDIIYNNVMKTGALLKSALLVARDRPYVYFEYPYSVTTVQNRCLFGICRLLRIKTILDVHDTFEQAQAIGVGKSAINRRIEADCLRNSTLISFSLNSLMWEHLIDAYKIPRNKRVVFLPNAFEDSFMAEYPHSYKSVKGRFNICYIGGLSKNRGIDILIDACSELHERYPCIKLYIFGNYGTGISNSLKTVIEGSDFITRKQVPREDLPHALHNIDLFILPYNPNERYTNLCSPTKFFEYMATGKPMLCTNCQSVTNIAEGGIIYTGYSSEDLKRSVEILIKNSELREEISAELIKHRSNHTWKERAKKLYSEIKALDVDALESAEC